MSSLKRFSTNSDPQSSFSDHPDPVAFWLSAKRTLPLAILIATVAVILYVPHGSRVLAMSGKTAPQAAAKEDSNIDPDAIDAIKKMAAYLHTLKSYQII